MERIVDQTLFRAEAVELNWWRVLHEHGNAADPPDQNLDLRSMDVRLSWACSDDLGAPNGPFTVWRRAPHDDRLPPVDAQFENGIIRWDKRPAGRVHVRCQASDPARPVGLLLYRLGIGGLVDTVGAAAVHPVNGRAVLEVRTSGATWARLVNGSSPVVSIEYLDEIVNAGDWEPLEFVGLPVDPVWPGTAYDTTDQGPASSPMAPVDAAIARVKRGGPPFGWPARTAAGVTAPRWEPPDPTALVDSIRGDVLRTIAALYEPGVAENAQARLEAWQEVQSPSRGVGTGTSTLATRANTRPWATLALSSLIDPHLNLAMGFGSAYCVEPLADDGSIAIGGDELLVTANYGVIAQLGFGGEIAAYAPRGVTLTSLAAPIDLRAEQVGRLAPAEPDAAWRESVRVHQQRHPSSVLLGTPTQQVAAVYPAGGADAEALIGRRDPQGWVALALGPDAPQGQPGNDRAGVTHGGVEIPVASGGRSVGYAVAVGDVFGVWSTWSDVPYTSTEPAPQPPRLVSLAVDPVYAGSPVVPTTVTVEVTSEWVERRPDSITVRVMLFPTPSDRTAPLPGVGAAPAGGSTHDVTLTFAGDTPLTSAGTVVALTPDGTAPLGPGELPGDEGRRYRITLPLPTLDFAAVTRWSARAWGQRTLRVGQSPSVWSPPVDATASSPVPIIPPPPPPKDGVPLASLPDADGVSHVRVAWQVPAGAPARRAIVWECSESALRQRTGLAAAAPTDTAADRLAVLQTAYNGLSADGRRRAFRRLLEADANAGETDVSLPRGSTDIHLFVVTLLSTAGIESPWPGAVGSPAAPHKALQVYIAPKIVRPEPPLVRTAPVLDGADPATRIEVEAASGIPISEFRMLRTRLAAAAMRIDTMGPPFRTLPAAPRPDATQPGGVAIDPRTGGIIYEATHVEVFPEAWEPWLVRAVAVPVDADTQRGERGRESEASDVVSVAAFPKSGPTLDDPTVDVLDPGHLQFALHTATTAPLQTSSGDHTLRAAVDALALPDIALRLVPETAAPGDGWQRGARAAGSTPLTLRVSRADASVESTVVVSITDPRGRAASRTVTLPAWTPPPPPVEALRVVEAKRSLFGSTIVVLCLAPAGPPYARLRVRARVQSGFGRPTDVDEEFELTEAPRVSRQIAPGRIMTLTRGTVTDGLTAFRIQLPRVAPPRVGLVHTGLDGTVTASVAELR